MMKPERWRQVDQLFQAALERAPEERTAFVSEACGGDDSLCREVEALLAADGETNGFIEAPAYAVAAPLLVEDETPSPVGKIIGHYQVISLVGRGGMGEVYRASDSKLSREVAVKVLPSAFSADRGRLRRFEREARAASALNHPNIITIHEVGQTEHLHFIVTEWVEGQTLRERLANGRMKLNEALEVTIQIAAALQAAHEAGIIHRDIKPENVMLRRDGLVKVLDFGLAKLIERQAPTDDSKAPVVAELSTESGTVLGTARYMSPEQARALEVDARSDIFSLGVALYEMITGRTPFEGVNVIDVMGAMLNREPAPLNAHAPNSAEAAPAELQRVVSKALRKDRDERYQLVREMLLDLKSLKQELDFEAKLKAAQTFAETGGEHVATAGCQIEAATHEVATARTTSRAEYVVSGINRRPV